MESFNTIYAILALIAIPLILVALLFAVFLPRDKRNEFLKGLRRFQC